MSEGCDVARRTASGRCWSQGSEVKERAARLEGGGKGEQEVVAAPTPTTWRGRCFRLEVLPVVGRCQRLPHPRVRKSGQQLPTGGFCS